MCEQQYHTMMHQGDGKNSKSGDAVSNTAEDNVRLVTSGRILA